MTYYAKLAYYRFISSIRGCTGFRGWGWGVLGKFLDPRMFSFVTSYSVLYDCSCYKLYASAWQSVVIQINERLLHPGFILFTEAQ